MTNRTALGQKISELLQGTCETESYVIDALELEIGEDEVMELIGDANLIEMCEKCGWWCEICEFKGEDEFICENCSND